MLGSPQLHWFSTQLCRFGEWKKVLAFLGASDSEKNSKELFSKWLQEGFTAAHQKY